MLTHKKEVKLEKKKIPIIIKIYYNGKTYKKRVYEIKRNEIKRLYENEKLRL